MKNFVFVFVLLFSSFASGQVSPIELYLPIHLDTLKEEELPLTFNYIIDPTIGLNPRYQSVFILVEKKSSQTLDEAISLNTPIVSKNVLNLSSFQYPSSSPDLENGKTYAWRIQTNEGANLVFQSDISEFTLLDPPKPGNYFEITKRSSSKLCKTVDGIAYLAFNTSELEDEIQIEVYHMGLKIDGLIFKDDIEQVNYEEIVYTNRQGLNYYSIDLKSLGLSPGVYELRINSSSHGKFEIKILY